MKTYLFFTITVVSLVGFLFIKPQLESRIFYKDQLDIIYPQAIDASFQNLKQVNFDILYNSNLRENLNWGLNYSNNGILRAKLQDGLVSAIRLTTEDCQVIAHTGEGIIQGGGCYNYDPKTQLDKPVWIQTEPALASFKQFSVKNKTFFLITSVHINDNWISRYDNFERIKDHLKLSVIKSQEEDVFIKYDNGLPSLTSSDWLIQLLPSVLKLSLNDINQVSSGLLLFTAMAFMSFAFFQQQRRNRFDLKLSELAQWIHHLEPELFDNKKEFKSPSDLDIIKNLRTKIDELQNFHFTRLSEHKKQILARQTEVESLEKKHLAIQKKLAEFNQLQSLYVQFQESSRSFLETQEDITDKAETISDTIQHGLNLYASRLYQITYKWQTELETISHRKLIRSLAERPSSANPKISQLEYDLNEILEQSKKISQFSLHLAIETQKLYQDSCQCYQAACHWTSFHNQNQIQNQSIEFIINKAQQMIPTRDSELSVRYQNYQTENILLKESKLSENNWVSLCYHIYMALIEKARQAGLLEFSIHSRYKAQTNNHAVIFSIPGFTDQVKSSVEKNHLELAKQIIQAHKMQLLELPNLHECAAIALTWEYHTSYDQLLPQPLP